MPTQTSSRSTPRGVRSPGKNRAPVNGMRATSGRSAAKPTAPSSAPTADATADSTAAMTAICRGVAPTRRIAANRCSRRAADRRVAPPMKTSRGNTSAAVTTVRTSVIPLASTPTPSAHSPAHWLGGVVLIRATWATRGCCERSAALRPTTTISESGAGRAAGPITPASRPG